MPKVHLLAPLLLTLVIMGCHPGDAQEGNPPVRPAFLEGDTVAVRAIMAGMSMRARAAQLMMVPVYSKPGEPESAEKTGAMIAEFGIGGVIAMQGDREGTRRNMARLNSISRAVTGTPLLTAMDAEWGAGMRLSDGIDFPKAMALGATENAHLTWWAGHAAGRELRRLGIGIDFAPVADVNSNPANPVIGNRSFGSRPEMVGELASAWAEGLRSAGVMAVGKHFPGHGDADLDSHHALPLIASDSVSFAQTELPPFRTLIHRGVEGIMTAHLDVPSLDSVTGMPTSLSPRVVRDLLIDSLGFEGLVFTDALTMAGAADPVPPGTREVAALNAGNDVLLFPSDPALVLDSIEAALLRGTLDSSRIDEACAKVLLAKGWMGGIPDALQDAPSVHALQSEIRQSMLVRLGREGHLDPALPTGLVVVGNRGDAMEARLRLSFPDLKVVHIDKGAITDRDLERVRAAFGSNGQCVVAFLDESNRPARKFGIPDGAGPLLAGLTDAGLKLHVTLFTSAYALAYMPDSLDAAWMLAHHEDPLTQQTAAAAWCGEAAALGHLPVKVGRWAAGDGSPHPAHRLPRVGPRGGMVTMGLRLDSLAEAAIAMASTPGMRILVLARDTIRYDGCHGHLGDAAQTSVQRHHLYDLASITKVATSTTLTMMAWERGMLTLDQPLSTLLPDHPGAPLNPVLGERTLRDVLAHRAGLPAWIPFYVDLLAVQDSTGQEISDAQREGWVPLCGDRCMQPAWCDTIRHAVRAIEPGPVGHYRYSDVGYYLLQDILEHLWGRPLDRLADSLIHQPLGLHRMGYRPMTWCSEQDIAPTELDTLFRKAHIRGTVHDPGAAMMGGVAGHAGLFSDAHDLALLMTAMGRGGHWGGVQLVEATTIEAFAQRAFPDEENRRGMGWDKPGLAPDEGASGNAGSWRSFGHSGFTGTLAWTDPERDWTVVILGNRICPDSENQTYIDEDIRTKALVIVEEALGHNSRFTDVENNGSTER